MELSDILKLSDGFKSREKENERFNEKWEQGLQV